MNGHFRCPKVSGRGAGAKAGGIFASSAARFRPATAGASLPGAGIFATIAPPCRFAASNLRGLRASPRHQGLAVNTVALAPLRRRWLLLDRARGLFNGFGYALVLTLVYITWGSLQGSLGDLTAGHLQPALRDFLLYLRISLISVIPGPILIPLAVNLAPRSYAGRAACLLAAAVPMFLWCEYIEGIVYSWDWQSVGYVLDGLLTTSLTVGVCAYHSYSRAAAAALLHGRIEHTRLENERQRARLQLLQAQIEPHFLFNTLSVVRALAKDDRPATVAMLDHLIRYFGAALPRLRDGQVPLAQEAELVQAYLAIYRARMGTRLGYEVCIPEDLGALVIPSMLLLTLVENALKHGVSPIVEGGFIRVSAARERNALSLKVADSGRGLGVRQGRGAGLANIRQQLLMTYGSEATLSLRSAEPRGAIASVSIPVK